MICLKCKEEIGNASICPHCGCDCGFEKQKQLATRSRMSAKSAAKDQLSSPATMVPFIANVIMGAACLFISILLINLLIIGSGAEVAAQHPWMNVVSLFLLVPVVYLLVSNVLSAKASFELWRSKGSKDAAKTSASCTYMVSLKLISSIFWVVLTLLSLVVSLVLVTSPAAFNKLDSLDELYFVSSKEDGEITYTLGDNFNDFIEKSIEEGDSYYVALQNAFEKVADTAEISIISPDSEEYNKLSDREKVDAYNNYTRYGVHIMLARELLDEANMDGVTGVNLWMGSTLDLFGVGTHRDVAEFARNESNTALAWIIAILAPLLCGASFYFVPKTYKQSIAYNDRIQKAYNEGLYDKNSSSPAISLFVFGGLYVVLAVVSLVLTFKFDLIFTVAQDALFIASILGHFGLFLLLLAIGATMIFNGFYFMQSHKRITKAISDAECEFN